MTGFVSDRTIVAEFDPEYDGDSRVRRAVSTARRVESGVEPGPVCASTAAQGLSASPSGEPQPPARPAAPAMARANGLTTFLRARLQREGKAQPERLWSGVPEIRDDREHSPVVVGGIPMAVTTPSGACRSAKPSRA